MTDDGHAPTVPDVETTGPRVLVPQTPDERYVMRTLLGSGGMGEIWLAHDVRIDRDVAIKLMRHRGGDRDAVARFLREARVQGRLEHPSIVPVHDLGDAREPFFAMKRLAGTTLADVIAQKDPAWTRRKLLARFVDVCLAVEFANERSVIHRDLKPANIMLGDFGETYVLDWGLARIADDREPARDAALTSAIRTADLRSDSGSGGHTEVGAMLGTPGYMAPEQMRGEAVDRRSDVFALGLILFEILAGTPAIPRGRFDVTLFSPHHRPSASAPGAEIPPELDDACARATALAPEERLVSARALADAVQHFLDGDRDLERRRELAVEHATRATALFDAGGDAARADAMREAGRALALDPANRAAQALLSRLLVERPKIVPPEAKTAIAEEREAAGRVVLRASRTGYIPFIIVTPLIKMLGANENWPFIALESMLIVQVVLCSIAAGWKTRIPTWVYGVLMAMHMALLGLLGVVVGPVLIMPVLVFGTLPIFLLMPPLRIPGVVIAMHALAIAVPLGLELTGITPSSFHFINNALVLRPWAVTFSPQILCAIVFVTISVQMVAISVVLLGQRAAQERAQQELHVQRWQLAQLVSTDE